MRHVFETYSSKTFHWWTKILMYSNVMNFSKLWTFQRILQTFDGFSTRTIARHWYYPHTVKRSFPGKGYNIVVYIVNWPLSKSVIICNIKLTSSIDFTWSCFFNLICFFNLLSGFFAVANYRRLFVFLHFVWGNRKSPFWTKFLVQLNTESKRNRAKDWPRSCSLNHRVCDRSLFWKVRHYDFQQNHEIRVCTLNMFSNLEPRGLWDSTR